MDDVQINIESIPLVTVATEQQLTTEPSNDGIIDVMQQLTRSDLTLDDLHELKEYVEKLPKQRRAICGVQQVSELDLINSMISSRALQG